MSEIAFVSGLEATYSSIIAIAIAIAIASPSGRESPAGIT
jgi:hypothetical protein